MQIPIKKKKKRLPLINIKAKKTRPTADSDTIRYSRDHHDRFVRNLALLGQTDAMIAKAIGLTLPKFKEWLLLRPTLSQALNGGRLDADGRVAAALLQRAIGYEADHDDIRVVDGGIRITATTKHIPADVRAIEYWLNNRAGRQWKSKTGIEMSGPEGGPVEMVSMTPAEAAAQLAAMGLARRGGQLDDKQVDDDDNSTSDD